MRGTLENTIEGVPKIILFAPNIGMLAVFLKTKALCWIPLSLSQSPITIFMENRHIWWKSHPHVSIIDLRRGPRIISRFVFKFYIVFCVEQGLNTFSTVVILELEPPRLATPIQRFPALHTTTQSTGLTNRLLFHAAHKTLFMQWTTLRNCSGPLYESRNIKCVCWWERGSTSRRLLLSWLNQTIFPSYDWIRKLRDWLCIAASWSSLRKYCYFVRISFLWRHGDPREVRSN